MQKLREQLNELKNRISYNQEISNETTEIAQLNLQNVKLKHRLSILLKVHTC